MNKQIHEHKIIYYIKKFTISFFILFLILFLTNYTYAISDHHSQSILISSSISSYNVAGYDSVSSKTTNSDNSISKTYSSEGLDIYAGSCILIDENTGEILYNKNAYEKMYPASTTKIITALLVLDNCNLNEMVNVSYYAVNSVPWTYSTIGLLPDERFSVKDLLYSLMIGSANDSAFVLAEYIANGGNNYALDSSDDTKEKFNESIEKFSEMMNKKVSEIGCENTHFVNPNGIHNENHYSTAYDLALIGQYAYKNPSLMTIVDEMSFSLPNTQLYNDEVRTCKCTNALLYSTKTSYYPYANGMKTGYTDAAGYCLVASAEKDGFSLIAVVLNSEKPYSEIYPGELDTSREGDCKRLFEYGFNNYSYENLNSAGYIGKTIKVINADLQDNTLDLLVKDNINVLVKKGEVFDITPDIKVYKVLAPIAKGEIIGSISYTFNGHVYTSDLLAAKDVYSVNYLNYVIVIFCIFIILLLLIIMRKRKTKKSKHKKSKHKK